MPGLSSGSDIFNIIFVTLVFYLQFDSILFLLLRTFFFKYLTKFQRLFSSTLSKFDINVFYIHVCFLLGIFCFFLKTPQTFESVTFNLSKLSVSFIFVVLIILFGCGFLNLTKFAMNNSLLFICVNIVLVCYLFFTCTSFISFLLVLELVSLFYLFFMIFNLYYNPQFGFKKIKHFVLIYLWSSFLTTLFLSFGFFLLAEVSGTLAWLELTYFNSKLINFYGLVVFFGLLLKLGVPGLHFFKVELYKYLDNISCVFFSLISTVVTILLFLIIFSVFYVSFGFFWVLGFIFFLILFFSCLYIFFSFDCVYTYLAYSGVFTVTTVLLPLLF